MINKDILDELERLGFGANIDGLESYVCDLRDAAGMGNPIVSDSQYDYYVKLLKKVKPDSIVFNTNWENEDTELDKYDAMLDKYGMCSIETIDDLNDLVKFKEVLDDIGEPVDMTVSLKDNGHGVRAVYQYGKLISGTTRGRYKKGRDITRHLKAILPNYIEKWKDVEIVEVRGEVLVAISTFEKYLKGMLKTPLSSVTSLIRDSVTDEELKLLDMQCYKILTDDESIKSDTLWGEFEYLKELGFDTPTKAKLTGVTSRNLNNLVRQVLNYFESLMDKGLIDYSCDGLVFAIDNNDIFYSQGKKGNYWKSNFALKMGKYWESNIYESIIREVVFVRGKNYLTPKAIIEPVVANNGSTVTTVPLYNVGVMERYGYTTGKRVYFRYGGEQGVTTCDYNGNSVSVSEQ